MDPRVPVRIVADAYAPLRVARWRWSGRPAVFDHLDTNGDGVVDEHDLDRGLGHGVSLLRDEAASPVGADAWQGSSHLFEALDENRDGLVTRADLEDGLGDHAVRLVHGEPAHGPRLPPGSAYGWRANARWIHFADREAKARYMSKAARHDAEDPILLGWARQFIACPSTSAQPPSCASFSGASATKGIPRGSTLRAPGTALSCSTPRPWAFTGATGTAT